MKHFNTSNTHIRLIGIISMAFLITLMGCYPDEPEYVEEYDIAYSNYSPDFNFSDSYTYSLPAGVLTIDDNRDPEDPPEFIDDVFGDPILERIRENLNAEGWTEVSEDANPDLIVLPSAFETEFLYFYNPDYWCWYYSCWDWWYPGYFPGYVSGFRTGTVLIQMADPNGVENDDVPVVWVGALNGLLQGSNNNTIGRIERNLDQVFSQPPFD